MRDDGIARGNTPGTFAFPLFFCLEALHWRLVLVRECVSIHNTNVMNTVRPSLIEFVDQ